LPPATSGAGPDLKMKTAALIRKLGFKAVELTLSRKVDLYNFSLSSKNLRWLRGLDLVSIHAPFALVRKADNQQEVLKQLDCLQKIYRQVRAKRVIVHSSDMPSPKILKRYKMNILAENNLKRSYITRHVLDTVLKKHKKLGICLDGAHAYSWSKNEAHRIIKKYKQRIGLVHICSNYRHKDNQPLSVASAAYWRSIEGIEKLKVPFVIEIDIDSRKSINWVRGEIKYIKSLF
jgi:sugar phosphate isomerase/epimerase